MVERIKLKEKDAIDQLKRFICFRLSKKYGFGTLVFDPCGDKIIFLLDIAEREFGKKARDELFDFLLPYHKMRVLKVLQYEAVKQKLWLAASDLAKEGEKGNDDDEEEDILNLFEGDDIYG